MKYTLKTLRSLKNWTQSEAAEAVGVSVDTWSKWERGKNAPGYKNVQKIVDTFGVPYDDIIFLPSFTAQKQKGATCKKLHLTVSEQRKNHCGNSGLEN